MFQRSSKTRNFKTQWLTFHDNWTLFTFWSLHFRFDPLFGLLLRLCDIIVITRFINRNKTPQKLSWFSFKEVQTLAEKWSRLTDTFAFSIGHFHYSFVDIDDFFHVPVAERRERSKSKTRFDRDSILVPNLCKR